AADVDARWKLLYVYFDWASTIPAPLEPPPAAFLRQLGTDGRRRHILWFIEHQPGDPLLWDGSTEGRAIIVPRGHASADPAGFYAARAAWLREVDAHPRNERVIRNAITFLWLNDKPTAETLLKRAQAATEARGFTFDHALAERLLIRALAAQPDDEQWMTWL